MVGMKLPISNKKDSLSIQANRYINQNIEINLKK